jgi:predicted ATPase
MVRHDAILKQAIEESSGTVVKTLGDGVLAAFTRPVDAVESAMAAQRQFDVELWPEMAPLRVRMGVHVGDVEERDSDYFGPVVNRAARLMAAGHGGQVLLSNAAAELVLEDLPEGATLRDLGEVRLKDLRRPERVWQLDAPGLSNSFPPLRVPSVAVHLPEPRTSLIGREDQVDLCVADLTVSRLLTLTGVGGCGKTRLAIAVARRMAEAFRDGAWFVDLSAVADPALVAAALASGLEMQGVTDPVHDLLIHLAPRSALVLLDNCEHLLDESAELTERILGAAPEVRILATSREPLGIDGEKIHRVTSLSPEIDGVRLFEDRARAVDRGFVLHDEVRPVVAELCRHLDGLPLAIELAAAQTSVFVPTEILAMLDDRFTLLAGGRRRGRQATLATVMDWSYQLLEPSEQQALRCAAIIPGSFVPELFAAVMGSNRAPSLTLLRNLVSKSLVTVETGRTESRYRLLETVRLFGESKLTQVEASSARDNLTSWVTTTLSGAEGAHRGEIAVREVEAVRSALSWSQTRGDEPTVVKIVNLAAMGWIISLILDVRYWLSVVESFDSNLSPRDKCAWRVRRAWACTAFGEPGMLEWIAEALESVDDRESESAVLGLLLRVVASDFFDPVAARRDLDRMLGRSEMPDSLRAMFMLYLGVNSMFLGNDAHAEAQLAQAEAFSLARGEPFVVLNARVFRATALELLGRSEEALDQIMVVVDDEITQRRWYDGLITETVCATSLSSLGRFNESREHLRRAISMVRTDYAHVPEIAGPAGPLVVAAAAIALAEGDRSLALILARGAIHTGIAGRYEGSWILATRLTTQLPNQLDADAVSRAIEEADGLTISELTARAAEVAA